MAANRSFIIDIGRNPHFMTHVTLYSVVRTTDLHTKVIPETRSCITQGEMTASVPRFNRSAQENGPDASWGCFPPQ